MQFSFQKSAWDESALTHAYTYRFPYTNRFIQHDDCIENPENPAMSDGYDYLSLMTKARYPLGTTVTTRCSFSGAAAPLLIFSEDLTLCEDGCYRYGNYFEVVLYKNGINVWRLWRLEDGTVTWHKRLGLEFPVSEGEVHTLSVQLKEDYAEIHLDGVSCSLRVEDLFPAFYVGITGCEGPCRFYDLCIDAPEAISASDSRTCPCGIRPYLAEQMRIHPSMTPQDIAKLCYQAAHGAEHLLSDLDRARGYFMREFEATPVDDTVPLIEPISDTVARVNIAAWKARGLSPDTLFDLFAATATVSGEGEARLVEYLAEAEAFLTQAETQISPEDWQAFSAWYAQNGRPAIHHSEAYRRAEKPAYRIVGRELLCQAGVHG